MFYLGILSIERRKSNLRNYKNPENQQSTMAEYWLISAPGDKTMQQTWETMNNVTSKQNNLCVNYKFHIPDLKVSAIRNRL